MRPPHKYLTLAAWLFALAAFSLNALAETKTFSWTQPTQNTDGSALAPSDIAGYRLECAGQVTVNFPGAVSTGTRNYGPGTYTCTLRTEHINGNVSAVSNSVTFTVLQPTPSPPTGFSVL